MGRRKKKGLSYFPLDCGLFTDRRIRRLIGKFGPDGALFYIYILCECYTNGYYVEYTDTFRDDAAADLGCSAEKIGLMVNYLLDMSLLDRPLFNTVKVLSSHGIQAQYQECCKGLRRDIEVEERLWVLREETLGFIKVRPDENKSGIYPDKSGNNEDKSGKYTLKERENKTKTNDRERETPPPSQEEVFEHCRLQGYRIDPGRFYAYYAPRGFPPDWREMMAHWDKTEFPYRRHRAADPDSREETIDIDQLRRVLDAI